MLYVHNFVILKSHIYTGPRRSRFFSSESNSVLDEID